VQNWQNCIRNVNVSAHAEASLRTTVTSSQLAYMVKNIACLSTEVQKRM